MTQPYPAEAVERLREASKFEWPIVDPDDIAALLSYVEGMKWRPIESAPEGGRVLVAGWRKPSKDALGRISTGSYWWWNEGCVFGGKDPENPNATHWHPVIFGAFPPAPDREG